MNLNMPGKDFHIFIPSTVLKSVSQDNNGDWVFEGIASTSHLDLFDDVVYPQSFANSVEFFKTKGVICYNHDYARNDSKLEKSLFSKEELLELKSPIGKALDAKITPEGLYIKGVLNKAHPMARKVWNEYLNNPDETFRNSIGLSIGAKPMGQSVRKYSPEHGKYVNFLPDLILYEVSLTTTPVNPHTSAWASVIKSLMNTDGEETIMSKETTIQITPQETIYDAANNRLVVKSVIMNEDGERYVLEQYVDLAGDVKKAVDDAAKDDSETDKPESDAGSDEGSENPFAGGGEEASAPAADPAAGAAPDPMAGGADPMAGGADPMAGGADPMGGAAAPDPMAGGADPMGGGAAPAPDPMAGGMGGADPMAGGGAGAPGAGDPNAMPDPLDGTSQDSSTALVLDKLDTVADTLSVIAGDLANLTQGSNISVPSDTTPPMENTSANSTLMKSLNEQIKDLKTIVELSTLNRENLRSVIKSVFEEIIVSASGEGTVTKSIEVVMPSVTLSTDRKDDSVIKSLDGIEINAYVLKSYADRYNEVLGRGHTQALTRAKIAEEASEKFGITQHEFVRLANKSL